MSERDDDVLARLQRLPAEPLEPATAERVRRAARLAFLDEHELRRRPLARFWSSAVVPALVLGTVCVYLKWAMDAASALYP